MNNSFEVVTFTRNYTRYNGVEFYLKRHFDLRNKSDDFMAERAIIVEWCHSTFGGPDSSDRWFTHGLTTIVIKSDSDASLFKLAWC